MADATLQRPEGTAEDWTIPQDWDRYTPAEHALWDHLFERQAKMLPERVVPEFMDRWSSTSIPLPIPTAATCKPVTLPSIATVGGVNPMENVTKSLDIVQKLRKG